MQVSEQTEMSYNGIDFKICNISLNTRSEDLVNEEYMISAKHADLEMEIVSYVYVDETADGFWIEHYTEDKQLIAALQCNKDLMLEDVYIEPVPGTDGCNIRFWWVCAQAQYYATRAQIDANTSIYMDLAKDWLPMATINAVASGLYCMGVK